MERLHCCLKDVLCAFSAAATWTEELAFVLFGLHAQQREDTGLSPAEAVFGALIVYQMNFCKAMKFLLILFFKNFGCSRLFSALPQFQHHAAQRAANRAALHPPHLGPVWRRRLTATAPLQGCLRRTASWTPLLHHPSQVLRPDNRRQQPQGLHGSKTPSLAARS